ncbi:MAG TPA: hypothetical protein VG963_00875, partial [Polyangiaceae bacterium]|nr:hypothetical protein [Polyangiaceae bacterium]
MRRSANRSQKSPRRGQGPSLLAASLLGVGAVASAFTPLGCSKNSNGADVGTASGSKSPAPVDTAPAAETCADNPLLAGCAPVPGTAPAPASVPEKEQEATFRAPIVTGKYVWSANPDSGRVAVIDAETYEIHAIEAGKGPTYVAAVSADGNQPRAIVINTGGDDAALIELGAQGTLSVVSVPLHQGADSWSVSHDGRIAIAWTDASKAKNPDPTDGFQDVTVVALPDGGAPVPTRLTVGYRPSAIAFNAAGNRAFAITQDGISVLDLDPGAVQLGPLLPLPSASRTSPDVSITPDGSHALARIEGSSSLYDVDLTSGSMTSFDLGGPISDLDLSDDGSRAVAVVQHPAQTPQSPPDAGPVADAGDAGTGSDAGSGALADAGSSAASVSSSEAIFIPIPAGLSDPSQRRSLTSSDPTFGSVVLSADGQHAVLFTTARPTSEVSLVGPDLTPQNVDLIAPVRAVFMTADGGHAIALQDPPRGSVKRGAFSVLTLDSLRAPKLVASDAPTVAVALSPANAERALVTVSDPASNSFGAYLVRTPNLQVDFQSLSSEPLASGTVPDAEKAFVAQVHPEGRISFIALEDGQSREITGFELS